jgi:tRNA threonylcarbamoyladenosine biosynthesis protein TsaB
MTILALEFASDRRSVAVVVDGAPRGAAAEMAGRNTRALALIEQALREAQVEREAVEVIAVGVGPGSYAGIRAAISTAQGWQLACGVRLLGISTVDCLAAQAQAAGILGVVHFAIDAQRHEFYFASYEISPSERRLVKPLRLATTDDVRCRAANSELCIWPELQSAFPSGRVLLPDAATLGQLAAGRTDFLKGADLEPIYLRAPAFVKAAPPRFISQS